MGEGGPNEEGDPHYVPGKLHAESWLVRAGADGGLPLPPEAALALGLEPGAEMKVALKNGAAEVGPNIHSLARVYIEPTSRCNLSCRTCVRNSWQEPPGDMEAPVFDKVAEGLRRFPHLRSVMFGGFGEPTLHPEILRMLRSMKALGLRTELTTNGTLLTPGLLDGLMETRLDTLWVSFDGVSEEGFKDVRGGECFRGIVASLRRLGELNKKGPHRITVGVSFVVMKRNIGALRDIDRLIRMTGASFVSVSNVIPYSAELERELLCGAALSLGTFTRSPGRAEISLPRLDVNALTMETLQGLLGGRASLSFMGNPVGAAAGSCRFVRERCMFIRRDGMVCPCMALLHPHTTYLHGGARAMDAYLPGDAKKRELFDIWNSPDYRRFRDRVDAFDFSPCHACGGCSHMESNKDDCAGSAFPACGGCLWAQGVIQCP